MYVFGRGWRRDDARVRRGEAVAVRTFLCAACMIAVVACGGADRPAEVLPLATFGGGHDFPKATSLALDATDIYVSTPSGSTGTIRRVRKSDGRSSVVAEVSHRTMDVAVDGTRVYFTDESGGPFAVDKTVGAVQPLGTSGETWSVAVDESRVYFTTWPDQTTGVVFVVDKDGTNGHSLAVDPGLPLRIVLDGTSLYWGNQAGEVWSVPKAGGPTVKLASASTLADFLAVDDAFVYFTSGSSQSHDGRVNRVAKSGGEVTVLHEAGDYVQGLTVLGDRVYAGTQTGILSIAKDGSASDLLEGTTSVGGDLDADSDAIYWVSDSGGVYRLERP